MARRQDASTGKIVDDPAVAPSARPTMYVKVHSPFQTYFDEQAYSISGINRTGPFDVLPKHYNFLTLLLAGPLTIKSPVGDQTFKITRGVMHVKANQVIVFLDI